MLSFFCLCSYQLFSNTHFTPENISFQCDTTINQNKEESSIHQKKLAKLYRIFWNMVGKKKYELKKYTESIENHLYINIKIYDNVLYPEYMSQKCHLLMTLSMKRKTTIKLTPFRGWDPHSTNCQICDKMKLLQKG